MKIIGKVLITVVFISIVIFLSFQTLSPTTDNLSFGGRDELIPGKWGQYEFDAICLFNSPFTFLINSISASLIDVIFSMDSDADGLTDEEEKLFGTEIMHPDTDGDGYKDGEEVRYGYDPKNSGIRLTDTDSDGLPDLEEKIYGSDTNNADTDGDGYKDGEEAHYGYDPTISGSSEDARLPKRIDVDLSEQQLRYYYGKYGEQGNSLVSSGLPRMPTPKGIFEIQTKNPSVLYRGADYYYPNTKWNLQFLPKYYIHGAYWHNNFGKPMSHGCVNVPYNIMERLYNWAEEGIKVIIHD